MKQLLAQSFFGGISPPPGVSHYGDLLAGGPNGGNGLIKFSNNLLKFAIVGAGIYAFVNIILAGFSFMSAEGDPKKVEQAWKWIYQSLLGLLVVAGSFVLAAIFGWLVFGDAGAILNPKIYGP